MIKKFKTISKKIMHFAKLGKSIIILTLVLSVLSVIIDIGWNMKFANFLNQVLYLFSTEAQVIAGLFGLTLTAFIFYIDKFEKDIPNEDSLLLDAMNRLKKSYYQNLSCISIVCAISIFLCLLTIGLIKENTKITFLLFETIFCGITSIISIVVFAISLLNPDKKEQEMKKITLLTQKELKPTNADEEASLEEFLSVYNNLENLCKDWADYCVKKNSILESYRGKIFDNLTYNLRILSQCEIFDNRIVQEMNRYRVYRNSIVHSCERISVSKAKFKQLELILKVIEENFEAYKSEFELHNNINFYDISNKIRVQISNQLFGNSNEI